MYAYELHGHVTGGVLDYQQFFTDLAHLDPSQRQMVVSRTGEVVAVPEVRVEDTRFQLRFLVGRPGDLALFYDPTSGEEREAQPRGQEIAVQSGWLILDAVARIVIQERRRPGVPLQLAIRALTQIGRDYNLAENATLSLGPIVDDSFQDELESLERIKSATVVLQRPNNSFRDTANSALSRYAADSNVNTVQIGATARPKESLSTDTGIIADIKAMVSAAFGPLRNVRIVGKSEGEEKDRTVSFTKHARRHEVKIPDDATRAEEREALLAGADDYLDELIAERGYPAGVAVDEDGRPELP